MDSLENIFLEFFDQLDTASKNISTLKKKKFNSEIKKILHTRQIPKPDLTNSTFFPDIIKTNIDESSTYTLTYQAKIRKKTFYIYFVIFDENLNNKIINQYNLFAEKIFIWFDFVQNYTVANSCSDNVNIYIYFTKFKKHLPQNQIFSLDCIHVNTGFAHVCRKDKSTDIVIFREEEWYKVLIHETFHNFGLDFSTLNNNEVEHKLKQLFNVNIEFNFFEAYCDTWARILNCVIYTHLNDNNNMKKLMTNLNKEKYFSIYQACKILKFMDLNYDLITVKSEENINICNHLYKEKTSVFTYYIITSIFMFHYSKFIYWCNDNNMSLLNFKKTPKNIDDFFQLLKKLYLTKPFSLCLKENETILNSNIDTENFLLLHSLRMSIIE